MISKSFIHDSFEIDKNYLFKKPNELPGSFDEAKAMIKDFLIPLERYHACANDCQIFKEGETICPSCGSQRYERNQVPAKQFIYYPLGPRLARYFGTENFAKILQTHCTLEEAESIISDITETENWK